MRRLLILRHAHSEPAGPTGDRARVLSVRGHEQCGHVLAHLRAQGLTPDTVVCSAATRTRETWERIAAIAPDAELRFEDTLYMGDVEAYRAAIADAPGDTVLLIGHNPTCAALATGLDRAGELDPLLRAGRFPTASLCVAEPAGERWSALAYFNPEGARG